MFLAATKESKGRRNSAYGRHCSDLDLARVTGNHQSKGGAECLIYIADKACPFLMCLFTAPFTRLAVQQTRKKGVGSHFLLYG